VARRPQRAARARDEHAERSEELARQRRELPWVRVEKDYMFEDEYPDG
jgi:predicted dithiol-disulfide oxidoreductase (DUF899 family)